VHRRGRGDRGSDPGRLQRRRSRDAIGRHGQTIDAIQYLANAILFRGRYDERKPVIVDSGRLPRPPPGDLDALALRMAEQASATASSSSSSR
jgi:predicted RNA-binding protein Jag